MKAEGEEGDRGLWDGWMASLISLDMNLGKLWETVRDIIVWRAVIHGVKKSWTRLGD